MDAYLSRAATAKFDGPPVLLVASSEAAMARAETTILDGGLRVGAKLPLEDATRRIALQPAATAVWLELDKDCGGPLDELLDVIARDVRDHRYAAVVSTDAAMLDVVAARIDDTCAEIIVNADDAERAAALPLALASRRWAERYADVASDKNAERLRQLSEEVGRIASTLARLSAGPGTSRPTLTPMPAGDIPPLSADTVRNVIRARRTRARYFSEELFADPAWDMLLDLLQAEIAQLRVPVSSLCIAAAVPATTALRWLKTLVAQGLFIRRADPHDGRRVFVELAPETSQALRRYFAEISPVAAI
jgi:DNA-binding MarR family transcriptional regulator